MEVISFSWFFRENIAMTKVYGTTTLKHKNHMELFNESELTNFLINLTLFYFRNIFKSDICRNERDY